MFESLAATPAATAAGLVAAACLVGCPLLPSRRAMLAAQLAMAAGFALHYGLLGLAAAAAMNALSAAQTLAAIAAPRWPALGRAGYALIPAMAAVGLWFWDGPTTALAAAAMATIAVARMQADETDLRVLLLGGALLWSAHDALVAAPIPLAADLIAGVLGVAVLLGRNRRARPAFPTARFA